jgi:hypothetical protein
MDESISREAAIYSTIAVLGAVSAVIATVIDDDELEARSEHGMYFH